MGNSKAVNDAMDKVFRKMMRWPRWYLRFQIWKHRNGDFAIMLKESGAGKLIIEEMKK
jgi:hypothetical protein